MWIIMGRVTVFVLLGDLRKLGIEIPVKRET
jgi:hypothetical protein